MLQRSSDFLRVSCGFLVVFLDLEFVAVSLGIDATVDLSISDPVCNPVCVKECCKK